MTAVLFDLDGTLLDTLADLTDSVNVTLAHFGCPGHSREAVRSFVGNGAAVLLQKAVPQGRDYKEPLRFFEEYYRSHCRIKTAPYDGIADALAQIGKKFPIAIVSNKPDSAVKPLCGAFFPGIYAQGQTASIPRKPAPDMVFAAMKAIGAEKCIYVGDSEVDVLTGRNAGVPVVSVLWGFRDRAQIGGSIYCEKPADLPPLLEKLIEEYK